MFIIQLRSQQISELRSNEDKERQSLQDTMASVVHAVEERALNLRAECLQQGEDMWQLHDQRAQTLEKYVDECLRKETQNNDTLRQEHIADTETRLSDMQLRLIESSEAAARDLKNDYQDLGVIMGV